jgi:tartrate dehydrogenase/decarboxylase / D-malate dehydrogenase
MRRRRGSPKGPRDGGREANRHVSAIRIAVIPGDDIGQEIVPVAVDAERAAVACDGVEATFDEFPWGCAYYQRQGVMMPEDGLDLLRPYNDMFLGAVGDPRVVLERIAR